MNPDKIIATSRQRSTELSSMYEEMKNLSKDLPMREIYLRPSMLPVCSVTLLVDILHHRANSTSPWSFAGDFFTSVGTTVHDTIESWCSLTSYKLWGNWFCPMCKKEWHLTHKNICFSCGNSAKYKEIQIKYLGFKGHIDCILIGDEGVIVGDYKTSSNNNINKASFKDHNLAYALQIMVYTYMLERVWGQHFKDHYGKEIKGCGLLYIGRDNPFNHREFTWDRSTSLSIGRSTLLKSQIAHNKVMRYLSDGNIDRVIGSKNCKDKMDYQNRVGKFFCYDQCYMYEHCVGSKNFEQNIRKVVEELQDGN